MRLGIFGGTFDPIHNGHLIVAERVGTEMRLDQVIFIPAGQPWFKEGQTVTDAKHRLEMTRLAVADNPHFAVSDVEVRRDGPTYTVDTLTELRGEVGDGIQFYFILGIDALNELHRWRKPCDVLDLDYSSGRNEAGSRDGRPGGAGLDSRGRVRRGGDRGRAARRHQRRGRSSPHGEWAVRPRNASGGGRGIH